MNVLTRPWTHIFDYKGRSTRREFWLFILLFYASFLLLGFFIGVAAGAGAISADEGALAGTVIIASWLWMLAWLVPFLSLSVRRLHDHDKSGWFFLIAWFPLFGWLFFLIMMLTPGNDDHNSYGPDPRQGEPLDAAAEVFA